LKYKYNNGKVELFHSGLTKAERMKMVNRFQSSGSEATRFLIGRCLVMGVGYTLTRAFRCCIMQPEWLRSTELQALGRVWRTGLAQKSIKTYSYRISLADFETERIIIARHDARGIVMDAVNKATAGKDDGEAEGEDEDDEDLILSSDSDDAM
jgi:hypothetical protein